MKKSLLAVVAALAMAGCSQNDLVDEIDNGKTTKQEIGFSTYVGKGSRAVDNYVTGDLQTAGMTVYSYITAGDKNYDGTGNFTPYMAGIAYTYADPNWTTTKDYYWPTSGKLQFFAIPTDLGITYNTVASGYPTITAPAGKDIVAAHTPNATYADNNTVALTFKHLLTKVNFKCQIENTDYTATVTDITIKGILGTGNGSYDFGTQQWNLDNVTEKQYTNYTQETALLVYPQTDAITVEVTYSVKLKDTEIEVMASATKIATVTTSGVWASNKNISYTLSLPINANKIVVSASVEDNWTNDTGSSTWNK
ncbi:hypothetical protein [Phocaeicola sp.]